MPERSNGAVSKTVGQATAPGVRIPLSPPFLSKGCASLGILDNALCSGEMREWLNRRDWKSRGRVTASRVRIPLSPPLVVS